MITPKEKAKELIETFEMVQIPYMDSMSGTIERSDMEWDNAKECALIMVEGISKSIIWSSDFNGEKGKYWLEVTTELHLL
jgi:hypothetical protein